MVIVLFLNNLTLNSAQLLMPCTDTCCCTIGILCFVFNKLILFLFICVNACNKVFHLVIEYVFWFKLYSFKLQYPMFKFLYLSNNGQMRTKILIQQHINHLASQHCLKFILGKEISCSLSTKIKTLPRIISNYKDCLASFPLSYIIE